MTYSFKGPITAADNARAQKMFRRRKYGFKYQLPYGVAMMAAVIIPMVLIAWLDLGVAPIMTFLVGLYIGVICLAVYQFRTQHTAVAQVGEAIEAHGVTTTTLSEGGIRSETELGRSNLSWDLVTDVLVDTDMIVLVMTFNLTILPLRDLRQTAEAQHILHAIGTWRASA